MFCLYEIVVLVVTSHQNNNDLGSVLVVLPVMVTLTSPTGLTAKRHSMN
jgi:hypothetical protein